MHRRLLVVLSEHSLKSEWVKTELRRTRKQERRENRRKFFPIALAPFDPVVREWGSPVAPAVTRWQSARHSSLANTTSGMRMSCVSTTRCSTYIERQFGRWWRRPRNSLRMTTSCRSYGRITPLRSGCMTCAMLYSISASRTIIALINLTQRIPTRRSISGVSIFRSGYLRFSRARRTGVVRALERVRVRQLPIEEAP
jgi:hypothetical protein